MNTRDMDTQRDGRTRRRGFTMIEATVSMVIVSSMLVAALNMVGSAARARRSLSYRTLAPSLAQDMITEILQCYYQDTDSNSDGNEDDDGDGDLNDDATEPRVWGREPGESGSNRLDFDDVDDYDGYTASPPVDRAGNPISGYDSNWTISVSVQYANPLSPGANVVTDLGLVRITVVVTDPLGQMTKRMALRGRQGIYDTHPIADMDYVTRVGVELQIGPEATARSRSGANIVNRVPAN